MTPCRLVVICQRFGKTYCIHIQGSGEFHQTTGCNVPDENTKLPHLIRLLYICVLFVIAFLWCASYKGLLNR